eukprot:scaffold8466_cov61-Phaeocystis_antarctica.AAC.1
MYWSQTESSKWSLDCVSTTWAPPLHAHTSIHAPRQPDYPPLRRALCWLWSDHASDTRDSHNTERSRSAQRTERREAGTALHLAVCE